jgi:hypothetical protein
MSTPFYDLASLVVVPSGVKAQKVYAQKPMTTDGQLTFSRASNASRVASNGLIEKVRTNLITYSQDFSDADWSKTGCTVTADYATAPDGTNTADRLVFGAAGNEIVQSLTGLTVGAEYSVSFYAKTESGTFNFQFGNIAYIIVTGTATTEWQRFTVTQSAGATTRFPKITSSGSGTLILWGFQVETGVPTDYIATTSAVSVGPLANVPRLDYLGSSCPKLILEGQRTNSITSSESTATGWTFTNSSSAVNQTTSPDGYVNADSIIPDATSGQHAINSANITASGSFTLSAFVKAGEYTKVAIRESANTGSYASFNLATGTKIEDNVSGASFIQSYGNGWYRIGVTGTYSGTIRLGINVLSNAYTTGNPSSGTTFFSGNASDKLFCWGMQCELGAAYATSYVGPTLGAAVTRLADQCYKQSISSLIGQTEGTFFVELSSLSDSVLNEQISLSDGTDANTIKFVMGSVVGGVSAQGRLSLTTQFSITKSTTDFVSNKKLAVAYKANDFVFYYNGEQVGVDTGGSVPAMSVFAFSTGASTFAAAGNVKQALVFKTRLTNAQLAELTTL